MGLAGRFVVGLGFFVAIIAGVAGYFLWFGALDVAQETGREAHREMARRTGELMRDDAQEGSFQGQVLLAPQGVDVQVGQIKLRTASGEQEALAFQVSTNRQSDGEPMQRMLYAPVEPVGPAKDQLLILLLLVVGGTVVGTVLVGAYTARRVAAPLRSMVDDVLSISRGRLDRRIRAEGAPKEVSFLARAVDRMVQDLFAGQETRSELEQQQREADSLRELRRNLQPLTSKAPYGYGIETTVLEAEGAGTGDFVDSLQDENGSSSLVVGSTATDGMAGALLMAMTRAYLRGAILQGAAPSTACLRTNASLNRDLAKGLYASAMVLRLEPESGQVELVSAGHQAPAVRWDAEAGELRKLQPNGIALGFDQGPIFEKSLEVLELQLAPGDAILLFSPRLFQCTNPDGKELAESGVYALAKIGIEQGLDAMVSKLKGFLKGSPEVDLSFALIRNSNFE